MISCRSNIACLESAQGSKLGENHTQAFASLLLNKATHLSADLICNFNWR